MLADQQAIQRHPHVLPHVEAVSHWDGLGRSLACTLGKRPAAVATDHRDRAPRVGTKPCGEGGSCAVGYEVAHAMAGEVDEDRPVADPRANREVVDAQHARLLLRIARL
jgi:hypothetical protein